MFIILVAFLINLYFYKILGFIILIYYFIFNIDMYVLNILLKNISLKKKKTYSLYKLSNVYIFTWKPIFKKNMYLGYLSELIVWKH